MIAATLFVYGHGNHVNWGDWHFVQLPSPGDLIAVKDYKGMIHYATVRHTEHKVTSVHRADEAPSAIVITDWKSAYDDDGSDVA